MTVKDTDLVKMGADVRFWKAKVAECESAPDWWTISGKERLRLARQQLRQAQKALRDTRRNVQMRMF